MKCKICSKEFLNRSNHLFIYHNIKTKEYYDRYIKTEDEEKCSVCGNPTKFKGLETGYREFCSPRCVGIGTKEKAKKTCLEKYGVDNPSKNIDIKKKIGKKWKDNKESIIEKISDTKERRYGCKHYNNPDKTRKTCLEKYGVTNVRYLESVKLKQLISTYKRRCKRYTKIKKTFEKRGFIFITSLYDFIKNGNNTSVNYICPEGHKHNIMISNWYKRKRCGQCGYEMIWSKKSFIETHIKEFVKTLGVDFISNDRTQIINPLTGRNLELDIWIPSLRKAIEFNGNYWHENIYQQKKDKIKKDQCIENGIDLLILEEDSWRNNKEKVLNVIRKFIE